MPAPGFALITLVAVIAGGALGFWMEVPERTPPAWIAVGRFAEVPDDGEPHRRLVVAPRWDGGRRLPDQPVGNVFVRRAPGSASVEVLEGWHGGDMRIPVEYDAAIRQFQSCCWKVSFRLDGTPVIDSGLYENRMRSMQSVIERSEIRVRWPWQ